MTENIYTVNIEIPLENKRTAEIFYDVLRVDKEPKRSSITKILTVEDNVLKANFSGELARQLRVAVNGFFEKIDLISSTIELLGPPVSQEYNHY